MRDDAGERVGKPCSEHDARKEGALVTFLSGNPPGFKPFRRLPSRPVVQRFDKRGDFQPGNVGERVRIVEVLRKGQAGTRHGAAFEHRDRAYAIDAREGIEHVGAGGAATDDGYALPATIFGAGRGAR